MVVDREIYQGIRLGEIKNSVGRFVLEPVGCFGQDKIEFLRKDLRKLGI